MWLQSPANGQRYQEIGVNLYVGLWQGPTQQQLTDLAAAGMRVICDQNAVGLAHVNDPIIAGWMNNDEPDNAQAIAGQEGYGSAVERSVLQADYKVMTATAMRMGETTASCTIESGRSGVVEVVDESRELHMTDGQFSDDFAADYGVHIYRNVDAG